MSIVRNYAATTPVDECVIKVMVECLGRSGNFGNPASISHLYGQQARHAVEQARQQIADLVGAKATQIVWTSGATESNNLALKCVAQARVQRVAHTLSLTFGKGELNLDALSSDLAFSSTSACNSAKNSPSHVLLALGHDVQSARQTIRLSLGRFTTEDNVDHAVRLIKASLTQPAFWAVAQP